MSPPRFTEADRLCTNCDHAREEHDEAGECIAVGEVCDCPGFKPGLMPEADDAPEISEL